MDILFILNEAPYGSERTYNGLRLAGVLAHKESNNVRVFLMGDAASAARRQQKTPSGYYNLETMLNNILKHRGKVGVCGTCMDARGLSEDDLIECTRRSNMEELAEWTIQADKTLVF